MSKLKGIVIGCGNIGALLEAEPRRPKPATHAGALMAHPKTELYALVDTNPTTLAKAGKLFPEAKLYKDLKRCLEDVKPVIAVVATPPSFHKAAIELCAKAGVKIIVCEKPIAHTLADAQAIEKMVKKHRINFVLNYQRRFFALFEEAKKMIEDGTLGEIEQVSCYYSNGIRNNGGHTIDALHHLLNDEFISAIGLFATHNTTHPEGDSNIDAILTTKKGVHVTLQSMDQSKWGIHDIRIFGTKGMLEFTAFGYARTFTPVQASIFSTVPQLDPKRIKNKYKEESMVGGALAQVAAGRGGVHFATQGIKVLKVLEALQKSAEQNGKLKKI